jgi:cyclopropane fatty-acyl-phospholipid synthase-like methyltransferase
MALTDKYFDTYAWDPKYPDRTYEATWRAYGFHVFQHYLEDLQDCNIPYPENVLDVGAANGRVIEELINRYGIDAYGIEQSQYMYNKAAPETRKRIQLGDATELIRDIPSGKYACAYETVGQYLPKEKLAAYLAQLRRVVTLDVVLLVSTSDMTSKPHHEQVIFESDEFWIRAFARAGFRSAGNPDYSPYWFQRID